MNRIVPAILIWACFLLWSCTKFEQEYYHGHLKYTINDSVVIECNSNPHLSWSQVTLSDLDYPGKTHTYGSMLMDCDQFDTSTTYHGGMSFQVYNPEISSHSFVGGFNASGSQPQVFAFTLFHPQYGGFYLNAYSAITVYFDEFNSNRINGYYYGDFYKPADSTTVYATCDFDFTP